MKYLSNVPKPHDIATAVNGLTSRQQVTEITLNNSATTTTIEDSRLSENSMISLMAISADSAAENPFVSVTDGQAVITHTNDTTTRVFKLGIIG